MPLCACADIEIPPDQAALGADAGAGGGADAGGAAADSDGGGPVPVLTSGTLQGASGISYKTESLSGTVGSDGTFEYMSGETVEFSIGLTKLGSSPGQGVIDLFDLAGLASPPVGQHDIAIATQDPAFRRVANLAVFFATMDANGDGTDGIVISPEVAALFAQTSLEFDDRLDVFREGPFTRLFLDAQGLFSTPHPMVTPPRAMQDLYQALGIDAKLFGLTEIEFDNRTVEISYSDYGYAVSTRTREPGNDNLVTITVDDDGNSLRSLDNRGILSNQEFDLTHRVIDYAHSSPYSTTKHTITSYDFNEDGYLVQIDSSGTVSGSLNYSWSSLTDNTIDARGDVVEQNEISQYPSGHSNDLITMDYDDSHNMLKWIRGQSEVSYAYDGLGRDTYYRHTGSYFKELATEYDAEGNVAAIIWRPNTSPSVATFTYDANGNLLLEDNEHRTRAYTYDTKNNPVRKITTEKDDGETDTIKYSFLPTGWGVLGRNLDTPPCDKCRFQY